MAAKILIVDDEPQFELLMRQRFRKKLREGEYDFFFALNGVEALGALKENSAIEIVLSDINMPKMDGLTLLSRLREIQPQVRTVMVSAYGDMDNIRAAMNLGAFDFVTKPINFEDLETTIEKTLKEVQITRKAARADELEVVNEKLRELDQMKSHFFANISHEFRTPLTVITGMVDQMSTQPERWFRPGIDMIRRNGSRLLDLVNQILDLAKLEAGKLQLKMICGDVVPYLRYIAESFHSLAGSKQIHLHFHTVQPQLVTDHDPEQLRRIVSNLLSNAIKFTPAGGRVSLTLDRTTAGPAAGDGQQLLLTVSDSGIGIPADRLPFIFDRFYQVDGTSTRAGEGTGIGLALVKELVHLMGGRIDVDSQESRGTTFRLSLPLRQTAPALPADAAPMRDDTATAALAEPQWQLPAPADAETVDSPERPALLIVEDNPDIVEYLRACLESRYELLVARDGQQGIDRAIEEVPDLIVSDVMMPHKNGFELCRQLKTDERTSHIPIVLLTAKADQESKIEGLTRGADAYLAKPFDQQELLVRLEQLLALRRKLQSRYRSLEPPPTDDEAIRQEDAFLQKVRQAVEENIDDETMSIAGLARMIGVSRAQLHQKVSALTGHSPSVFVRNIRLYQARELLKRSDLNISQIAYEVGFRDPAYFTRTFTQEFGHSPKEARR